MKTNLQKLRERNGLNQTQMGSIIQKSQQFYQRYEDGKTKLPMDIAILYADYFNVSLDYLCGRQYNNNIGYISDERKDAVKNLTKLDDNSFKMAEGYIKALLDYKKF